jgi:hypothetical protein
MPEERQKSGNCAVAAPSPTQRAHPRYQFTATAEALDSQHRLRMSARTSDLGKGGCYLDTFSPFQMKTGVKLRITKEKVCFEAEATVVYSKMGMGMGLAKEPGYVLNDLIVALMRKGTLSEEEGRTMLLRLVHHDFRP